jgi:hypothetical protein
MVSIARNEKGGLKGLPIGLSAKLAQSIYMLMLALPEDDHEGRLRCSVYRAALGQRASMITLACNEATVSLGTLA